jgi:hypothetical protein
MFLDFFEKNSMFLGVFLSKKYVLSPPWKIFAPSGKKSADAHAHIVCQDKSDKHLSTFYFNHYKDILNIVALSILLQVALDIRGFAIRDFDYSH